MDTTIKLAGIPENVQTIIIVNAAMRVWREAGTSHQSDGPTTAAPYTLEQQFRDFESGEMEPGDVQAFMTDLEEGLRSRGILAGAEDSDDGPVYKMTSA